MSQPDNYRILDGVRLPGEVKPIDISNMKKIGTLGGVQIYEDSACPRGTLELWDQYGCQAIIRGLGEHP